MLWDEAVRKDPGIGISVGLEAITGPHLGDEDTTAAAADTRSSRIG